MKLSWLECFDQIIYCSAVPQVVYCVMKSKWYELKPSAIKLRKKGYSIRDIEKALKIPRSTLSGWLKDIKLTKKQKEELHNKWKTGLDKARKRAVIWHNQQKQCRIAQAKKQAELVLSKIDIDNKHILELALAMLYLGEGDKTKETNIGSSDLLILKFFIKSLETLFKISRLDITCQLHLRIDQDERKMIHYWSKELDIPKNKFRAYKDKRTAKSRTYPHYKGVCVVRCGKVAIQRRIVHLSKKYCKIVAAGSVSSVG